MLAKPFCIHLVDEMIYLKPLDASWIKSWSNWQRFNLEVVVPKRREGSSPFERTIFLPEFPFFKKPVLEFSG